MTDQPTDRAEAMQALHDLNAELTREDLTADQPTDLRDQIAERIRSAAEDRDPHLDGDICLNSCCIADHAVLVADAVMPILIERNMTDASA